MLIIICFLWALLPWFISFFHKICKQLILKKEKKIKSFQMSMKWGLITLSSKELFHNTCMTKIYLHSIFLKTRLIPALTEFQSHNDITQGLLKNPCVNRTSIKEYVIYHNILCQVLCTFSLLKWHMACLMEHKTFTILNLFHITYFDAN